jgi:hypothetical protein
LQKYGLVLFDFDCIGEADSATFMYGLLGVLASLGLCSPFLGIGVCLFLVSGAAKGGSIFSFFAGPWGLYGCAGAKALFEADDSDVGG